MPSMPKAEALEYGAIVSDGGVTFRLWAPTAQDVKVVVYNADKTVAGTMTWPSTVPVAPGPIPVQRIWKVPAAIGSTEVHHPATRQVAVSEIAQATH